MTVDSVVSSQPASAPTETSRASKESRSASQETRPRGTSRKETASTSPAPVAEPQQSRHRKRIRGQPSFTQTCRQGSLRIVHEISPSMIGKRKDHRCSPHERTGRSTPRRRNPHSRSFERMRRRGVQVGRPEVRVAVFRSVAGSGSSRRCCRRWRAWISTSAKIPARKLKQIRNATSA